MELYVLYYALGRDFLVFFQKCEWKLISFLWCFQGTLFPNYRNVVNHLDLTLRPKIMEFLASKSGLNRFLVSIYRLPIFIKKNSCIAWFEWITTPTKVKEKM